MNKQIAFPDATPDYCAAGPCLDCAATVDGHPATYSVTAEALEDHFGARSLRADDLLCAFQHHRQEIQDVARALFEMTGAHRIVLHSGHFRFAG
ncbi:hypothetical protein BKK79_24715 [Cupriavidus sp. USMAA2-4]|uniref:DUF1488 domain-containing protein n=1 Tax=Cupriavidus malaysiensis TaxID=367825 RepID=A0ABN4TTE3_9BURK|nr:MULTISPECIES: DUF1488 domain-containing protein [Cupriavidus]AOY95032.1 hypothetical protein BKK79_24715 [Cupriavidus sp. USMAA2-4]AOZ02074.1 hypothetical protein BKK81_22375 [Cupriavidus sp. USMAHM13]AOZ10537.1 hypothetical protein BKK80_33835 [Cupriavidus malaysiensis]